MFQLEFNFAHAVHDGALNIYGGEYGKFTTFSAEHWDLVANSY